MVDPPRRTVIPWHVSRVFESSSGIERRDHQAHERVYGASVHATCTLRGNGVSRSGGDRSSPEARAWLDEPAGTRRSAGAVVSGPWRSTQGPRSTTSLSSAADP